MSGITPIDRRDLTRLLTGLLHATKRDDVKVEVKYYVQFSYAGSKDEDMAVQTVVDPYSEFNRKAARSLVEQAIERLDLEERTKELAEPVPSIIGPAQVAKDLLL